jgi:hypothetical protein
MPFTHAGVAYSGSGSALGESLMSILMTDDIVPGSEPGYFTCKAIYLSHPLGGKMVDAPINMAQSQQRKIAVQDAPDEVLEAFAKEWEKVRADEHIANVTRLSRIYGLASMIVGVEGFPSDKPLEMDEIWRKQVYFNEFDPLNTAGSLVLSQIPTSSDFNKPVTVRASGETFHRSRYVVVMNEAPIYIAYTPSAFGFVGRSVYQRALYPLKSFIRTMIADDMVATKLGLLVTKTKSPGSVITKVMDRIVAIKRAFLKEAQTGQVLSVGTEEDIETLNMQNVDGAGTYSRTNIIKNIATSADMPAHILDNETMVSGFGEGTEDAKNIARYIERVRMTMQPAYAWFDNIVQYRAWNPEFVARLQGKYPELKDRDYKDIFSEWRRNFEAEWPSLLIEPESEAIKKEDVKFQAVIALTQTLVEIVDPANRARVIQWAADSIGENKLLFAHELVLDIDELQKFQEEQQQQESLQQQAETAGKVEKQEFSNLGPEARKFGRFDSSKVTDALMRYREAVERLPARRVNGPTKLLPGAD